MYENPYASSLEARIYSATPVELVKMLYEAAIEAVQAARDHLRRGEIGDRSRAVGKAIAILAELNRSLDQAKGGELSTKLALMYDYLQRTLIDANYRQADDGLAEAETLLKTLHDAWSAVNPPRSASSMRPDNSTELHPAAYGLGGSLSPFGECAQRIENQWCA